MDIGKILSIASVRIISAKIISSKTKTKTYTLSIIVKLVTCSKKQQILVPPLHPCIVLLAIVPGTNDIKCHSQALIVG